MRRRRSWLPRRLIPLAPARLTWVRALWFLALAFAVVFDIEPAPFLALLDKLARDNGLAGRSMGMSGDFETAIMLGATHVRVGTALFGSRG